MFSFKRAEVLPLEVYGKLPLAKDYLRVGCADESGARWRDWLDRAYSGSSSGTFPPIAWPAWFVAGEAWGEPLVGQLWPSSDAGGLRKFPISFLVARKRKAQLADFAAGWRTTAALWHGFGALRERAESGGDGQRFLAAARAIELDVEQLPAPEEEGVEFNAWKAAIDGGDDGLTKLFRRLRDLARGGPRAVLRLPLVSDLDGPAQARAWHQLLVSLGLLDGQRVASVFLPAGELASGAPSFVVFSARVFGPADVVWLAPPTTAGSAGLEDLSDERVRRADVAPPSSQPLANSLAGAWTSFVARGA